MKIDEIIAKGPQPFEANDSLKSLALIEHLERALVQQKTTIGTTELIRIMRPGASQQQVKSLVAWLQHLRRIDTVRHYFTRGTPAPGTFGKPRILWKIEAAKPVSSADRIAWIKENDPELYAEIYAPKPAT